MWGKNVGGVRTRQMDKGDDVGEKPIRERTGNTDAKVRAVSPSQGRMQGVESGGTVQDAVSQTGLVGMIRDLLQSELKVVQDNMQIEMRTMLASWQEVRGEISQTREDLTTRIDSLGAVVAALEKKVLDNENNTKQNIQAVQESIKKTKPVQIPQPDEERSWRHIQRERSNMALEAKKNLRCDKRTFKLVPEQGNVVHIDSFRLFESYMSEFLRGISEDGCALRIEDIRRDSQGNIYCQIVERDWDLFVACTGYGSENFEQMFVDLSNMGKYVLDNYFHDPKFNLIPFVVNGIPLDFDLDNLAREIAEMNLELNINPVFENEAVQFPTRLSRFHKSESGQAQKSPSKSIMIYVHKDIAPLLSKIKLIRVEYIFCPVNIYKKKLIKCMRCRKWGYHFARNCHAQLSCSTCGGNHETRDCNHGNMDSAAINNETNHLGGVVEA